MNLLVNEKVKIVLVNPDYRNTCVSVIPFLPVGLGFVAQALFNNNVEYKVFDLNFQLDSDLYDFVKNHRVDYLGFSLMSYRIEKQYDIIKQLKRISPNTKIIIGGPHSIASGMEIFDECECVDIVVKGEGEQAIIDIVNEIELPTIKSIIYRQGTTVHETDSATHLNINELAFPTYYGFDFSRYNLNVNPRRVANNAPVDGDSAFRKTSESQNSII